MAYGTVKSGRVPNSVIESHPWRIRQLVPDFTLEDVWALPIEGGADDFPALLETMSGLDPANSDSAAARALWRLRDLLGAWFGIGRTRVPPRGEAEPPVGKLSIPGTREASLAARLPQDLRRTATEDELGAGLFSPLYRTEEEAAAEISNQTVHGVMHLAWVDRGEGRYQGQMAVYVKPRGRFGRGYMELIKPFRHWIVYPALMRQIERSWDRRAR
jgi:hypothetical protein